jgi:hypothetical protein
VRRCERLKQTSKVAAISGGLCAYASAHFARIYSKTDSILSLKDLLEHQIELCPNPILWFYYDSINSLAIHQPKIVSTLFETTLEAATI